MLKTKRHIFKKKFLGKNINCWDKTGNDQFGNVVNQYCWITGTHRLGDHEWHNISSQKASENEKIVHSYYQWIPYFLILLVNVFYGPINFSLFLLWYLSIINVYYKI